MNLRHTPAVRAIPETLGWHPAATAAWRAARTRLALWRLSRRRAAPHRLGLACSALTAGLLVPTDIGEERRRGLAHDAEETHRLPTRPAEHGCAAARQLPLDPGTLVLSQIGHQLLAAIDHPTDGSDLFG